MHELGRMNARDIMHIYEFLFFFFVVHLKTNMIVNY